jgi:hypothetical protein
MERKPIHYTSISIDVEAKDVLEKIRMDLSYKAARIIPLSKVLEALIYAARDGLVCFEIEKRGGVVDVRAVLCE